MDDDRMRALARRLARMQELLASPHAHLDEMALSVSAVLQPRLDTGSVVAELDHLAAGCTDATRDGVVRFLAHECGFAGDQSEYHDWQNSCLDRVVARRRGMPITLSIVTIEVARRLGVPLVGVGLPGHFLVGDRDDPEWFADPFRGVSGLDVDDCRRLLRSIGASRWHPALVAPTPNRAVIVRILNNLRVSCDGRNDEQRLAMVMRMRAVVAEADDDPLGLRRATSVWN
jgi:regulator of sirC expression with transglutaminase-like and TPR domain